MNSKLQTKVINWLKTFPKYLNIEMRKFRKGDSQFHLIRLVSEEETIRLWLDEYPNYCLNMIKEELTDSEFMDVVKEWTGLEDEELEEYKNDDEEMIQDDFVEYMIIDMGYGSMLPSDLFCVMKDKILAGDIVYGPYYETRMYYGINLACLDKNHNIKLEDDEGHCPRIKLSQKRIMEYNKVCFEEAINYIEYKYGDWGKGSLIEMWK